MRWVAALLAIAFGLGALPAIAKAPMPPESG
jgi:hypothetical protein